MNFWCCKQTATCLRTVYFWNLRYAVDLPRVNKQPRLLQRGVGVGGGFLPVKIFSAHHRQFRNRWDRQLAMGSLPPASSRQGLALLWPQNPEPISWRLISLRATSPRPEDREMFLSFLDSLLINTVHFEVIAPLERLSSLNEIYLWTSQVPFEELFSEALGGLRKGNVEHGKNNA